MSKIIVVYHSGYGHTQRTARRPWPMARAPS